ncbi:Exosome non-catalytic core component [Tulasnella sp. 332]|nr:Exosome non-catalytic core component [Tulasnella sp. 332]
MSRPELLSSHNYRSDGRRPKELRDIGLTLGSHGHADGSATVSHGLTCVLVTVYGPREAKNRANSLFDRAILNVNVDVPLFSGGGSAGKKRGRGDKRTLEFTSNIKSTFEPIIQTQLYPRSQIDISVQVLQQDGGLLQASINATTLALIDAGVALNDYVCAMTCALHDTVPLLDLTSIEESDLPNLTVAVLPRSRKITLLTLETRIHMDRFEQMFEMGGAAGKVIHEEMLAAVKRRTERLVTAMGKGGRDVQHAGAGGAATAERIRDLDFEMEDF